MRRPSYARPPAGTSSSTQGLGLRLLDAVDQVLVRIGRWPEAAPLVPDLPDHLAVRRAPLHTFPYHVAYLVIGDTIHVLAIAHDHRRPNYWRERTD